jgi:hypothetical protein
MVRKVVIPYLAKIVPAFLVCLLAWRALGLSAIHNTLVALAFDVIHRLLDPTGTVRSVAAAGKEFVLGLSIGGKTSHLKIVADDLTGNTIVLLAFFLASPIRSSVKSFAAHLAGALGVLFCIHVVAVAASTQHALFSSPDVLGPGATVQIGTRLLLQFGHFYELIGMYLFPLVLWVPYIASRLMRSRRM